jgi:hypothetical protein
MVGWKTTELARESQYLGRLFLGGFDRFARHGLCLYQFGEDGVKLLFFDLHAAMIT